MPIQGEMFASAGEDLTGFLGDDPATLRYVAGLPPPDLRPLAPPEARIAIIDSGVNLAHPQLAGLVVESRSFTDEPAGDTTGHGTSVALLATFAGPLEILSARVTDANGLPQLDAVLAAIDWAAASGALAVNLSLGFDADLAGAGAICDRMAAHPEVLFIAAKSNRRDGRFRVYPAACPGANVQAVGSAGMDTSDGSIVAVPPPQVGREGFLRDSLAARLAAGPSEAALIDLAELRALAPSDATAAYSAATVLFALARTPEARDAARAAVALDPGHADAWWLLALCEANLAAPGAAAGALDALLALDPGHAEARRLRAFLARPGVRLPADLQAFFATPEPPP